MESEKVKMYLDMVMLLYKDKGLVFWGAIHIANSQYTYNNSAISS